MKKIEKPKIKVFVGRNLRRLRKGLSLSLDDVAYNTGISKAYLSQIENGQSQKPSVETAYILAKAFKVPFELFCVNPVNKNSLTNKGQSLSSWVREKTKQELKGK